MAEISRLLYQRHALYRGLLAVEVLALVGLRALQGAPRLVSVVYLVISGVAVLVDSPLLPRNRLHFQPSEGQSAPPSLVRRLRSALLRRIQLTLLWVLAAVLEGIWQVTLLINPNLAVQLSVPHLVIWLLLLLTILWDLVNALADEPVFSGDLLMGAAAGYLLVGFTGGIVLNSLLVLDPSAFQLPPQAHPLPDGIGHAPAMLGAAFASLTTLGSPVLAPGHLTSLTASVAITIVGQLYVAILIAGVLGKARPQVAARRAAHLQRQRGTRLSKLGRPRR